MKQRSLFFNLAWPYVLICTILCTLFYLSNYRGNWSFWADQELILGYNGLLINSGFPQEYLDHPGFISIRLLAVLLQTFHFLGIGQITTIDDFNRVPVIFSAMQYVVMVARHQTLVFAVSICCITFFLAKHLTKKNDLSLIISALVFVSNGIFYHFTITRTESFAYLFFILSVFFFIYSFQKERQISFFRLAISFAFLFLGALNKAQVLLFVPLYFSWGYYFISGATPSGSGSAYQKRSYFWMVCATITFLMNVILYWNKSNGLSLFFNLALIAFLNAYGCLLAHKRAYSPFLTLAIINLTFFLSYFLLNGISQFANQGQNLFSNIDNPISMMRFITADAHPLGLVERIAPVGAWYEKTARFLLFFAKPILELFTKITASTLFLLFSLGYIWFFRKTLSPPVKLFGLFCFVSYYLVALVNSVRYENAYHYVLFHEFFLLSYTVLLICLLPSHSLKIKVGSVLIFLIIFVNSVPYTNYFNWLKRKGHHPFCTSGLVDYHQRMDIEKIRQECLLSKTEH